MMQQLEVGGRDAVPQHPRAAGPLHELADRAVRGLGPARRLLPRFDRAGQRGEGARPGTDAGEGVGRRRPSGGAPSARGRGAGREHSPAAIASERAGRGSESRPWCRASMVR